MIKITTRGVTGAGPLLQEFNANITRVLGSRPLDAYIDQVQQQIEADAPVRTGYLKANIKDYRVDQSSVAVTSWAGYSQFPHPETWFYPNIFQTGMLNNMLGETGANYLRILINKYQNRP